MILENYQRIFKFSSRKYLHSFTMWLCQAIRSIKRFQFVWPFHINNPEYIFLFTTWQLRSSLMHFIGLAVLNYLSQHTLSWQLKEMARHSIQCKHYIFTILILTTATVSSHQQGCKKLRPSPLDLKQGFYNTSDASSSTTVCSLWVQGIDRI